MAGRFVGQSEEMKEQLNVDLRKIIMRLECGGDSKDKLRHGLDSSTQRSLVSKAEAELTRLNMAEDIDIETETVGEVSSIPPPRPQISRPEITQVQQNSPRYVGRGTGSPATPQRECWTPESRGRRYPGNYVSGSQTLEEGEKSKGVSALSGVSSTWPHVQFTGRGNRNRPPSAQSDSESILSSDSYLSQLNQSKKTRRKHLCYFVVGVVVGALLGVIVMAAIGRNEVKEKRCDGTEREDPIEPAALVGGMNFGDERNSNSGERVDEFGSNGVGEREMDRSDQGRTTKMPRQLPTDRAKTLDEHNGSNSRDAFTQTTTGGPFGKTTSRAVDMDLDNSMGQTVPTRATTTTTQRDYDRTIVHTTGSSENSANRHDGNPNPLVTNTPTPSPTSPSNQKSDYQGRHPTATVGPGMQPQTESSTSVPPLGGSSTTTAPHNAPQPTTRVHESGSQPTTKVTLDVGHSTTRSTQDDDSRATRVSEDGGHFTTGIPQNSEFPRHRENFTTTVPQNTENLATMVQGYAGNLTTTVPRHNGNLTTTVPQNTGNLTTTVPQNTENFATTVPGFTGNLTTTVPRHNGNLTTTVPQNTGNLATTVPGNFTAKIPQDISELTTRVPQSVGNLTTRVPQSIGSSTTRGPQNTSDVTTRVGQSIGNLTTRVPQSGSQLGTRVPQNGSNYTTMAPKNDGHSTGRTHQAEADEPTKSPGTSTTRQWVQTGSHSTTPTTMTTPSSTQVAPQLKMEPTTPPSALVSTEGQGQGQGQSPNGGKPHRNTRGHESGGGGGGLGGGLRITFETSDGGSGKKRGSWWSRFVAKVKSVIKKINPF